MLVQPKCELVVVETKSGTVAVELKSARLSRGGTEISGVSKSGQEERTEWC